MSDVAEYAVAAAEQLAERPEAAQTVALDTLGFRLLREFAEAEQARQPTEERWLKDLRQYKGQYDPEVLARLGAKRSKVFVRKTRTKVKTVDSRVMDLLFPAGADKNWDVQETPKPRLAREDVQELAQQLRNVLNRQPTREEVEAAAKEIAKKAAKAMAKTIEDQLAEAKYKQVCSRAVHSGHLYGTGIVKGPLVERRIRTRFAKKGGKWVAQTEVYVVPFIDFVPLWRFYPDMAATCLEQCRYVFERHQMARHEIAELARRKSFRGEVIKAYIAARPDGQIQLRMHDTELRIIGERNTSGSTTAGFYEVLERWGWLTGDQLIEVGVRVPEERRHEAFFSNVWLLPNGEVIKAVLHPIDGTTWPYHLYQFDRDETSIFCEGLASIMRDDQTMMNAATRLMLDNAAITSGPQLEVTLSLLARQDNVEELEPWKLWFRNSQSPGTQAIRAIELPSRLNELQAMSQLFETQADETTAIPRYMTGENASQGAAGTSSGLSMLMGAVNIVLKDLVGAWDEVTESFIRAMYAWNMKFSKDDSIKGDFDCAARGTASLVAKEVRARQLDEFATLSANPLDAPFIKREKLLRLRAEAHELVDVVKTEDEIKAEQSSQMAQMQAQLQQQMAMAQLQELQGRAAKLMADAEVAKARAQSELANVELIVAKAVEAKVSAVYAALQAGGVATSSPHIAPAGDEILRSSGWRDATPDPTIAQLNGPPVQAAPAQQPIPAPPAAPDQPGLTPQTGMAGREQGIETPGIDG